MRHRLRLAGLSICILGISLGCSPRDISGIYQNEDAPHLGLQLTRTGKLIVLSVGGAADYAVKDNKVTVTDQKMGFEGTIVKDGLQFPKVHAAVEFGAVGRWRKSSLTVEQIEKMYAEYQVITDCIAEARSNLGALRSLEIAYFAEWDKYIGNQSPTPVADRNGNRDQVYWRRGTRFELLGFEPQSGVRCSYALEGIDNPSGDQGFIGKAICDCDGDGELSTWSVNEKSTDSVYSGDKEWPEGKRAAQD